jgi:hypothetical protein
MEMILNPWVFGLEAVQQGWQAQIALAFRLMQSFVPDQTTSPLSPDAVADDIKAPEAIAAIADVRKARLQEDISREGHLQDDISRKGQERIKTGGRS